MVVEEPEGGAAEVFEGLIELHRRIARGFRNLDNYRFRILLIARARWTLWLSRSDMSTETEVAAR